MKPIKYILILLFAFLSITVKAYELPDLGERSETFLPPQMEKRLGQEFMKEIRLSVPIINDTIINDYIQNLGDQLVTHATTKKKKFTFFVINDSAINSFAGPDAYIGVNSGTITAANSESELAGVMAHEIAHITQHHIERLIQNTKITSMATLAGTLAAIIVGTTIKDNSTSHTVNRNQDNGSTNLASSIVMASIGGAVQHMINFTREHEIEADNLGIKILYNSSLDPQAIPTFFERIQKLHHDYENNTPLFLLTHPVTSDRIAEAKNRIDQLPRKTIKTQNIFPLISTRTEVLTSNNLLNTTKYFQTKLNSQNSAGYKYGYALALYQNHQYHLATNIVTNLQKECPNEVLFQMLAAQLAVANKQSGNALGILKAALTDHANYYPLIIQYGETLITAKQAQVACDFIRAKIRRYPDDAKLYRLLSQAYAQNNQKADAYQAKAKAYEIDGYNRPAAILLQQALKTPKLSTNNRAIINARIEQLKKIEKNL